MTILLGIPSASHAELVGFKFSGSILTPAELFGETIAAGTLFSGHATYDPAVAPSHPPDSCSDCNGYQQDIVNGFFFEVGPLAIRADSYVTMVFNKPPEDNDVLSFRYSGGFAPPLSSPLVINGDDVQTVGVQLNLAGPGTAFPNSELPIDPAAEAFILPLSTLWISETDDDQIDLLGMIGSLSRFSIINGDFNLDEIVDGADWQLWRANYGSTINLFADGNHDAKVDAADYTIWRDNYAPSGAAPSDVATGRPAPEPSSVVVLALGCVACFWRPRLQPRV